MALSDHAISWRALFPFTLFRQPEVSQPRLLDLVPGGLGIEGLPDDLGRLPCGSPTALIANDSDSHRTWMPALLADAVMAGPVCLLAGEQILVDELLSQPVLAKAHASGRLVVWLLGPGLNARLPRNGLASLFRDMEQIGLTAQQSVFVLPANRLFMGLDLQQLNFVGAQLQRWCHRRQRPVVLCVEPAGQNQTDAAARMVRTLTHVFMHVASLGQQASRTQLYLERWESDSGAFFDACYGLKPMQANRRLVYDGSLTVGKVPELASAPDQFDVITTQSVVRGKKGVPAHWTVVDSDSGVLSASQNAIAATVLIDAGAAHEFDVKARLVHQLRLSHPPTLRILVRETQGKLRANFEQALLRLGANEVIYREMGFPRMLQLLQESRRQAYTKKVAADYEQALGGFMPASARGYQPPGLFCDLVSNMVGSTLGLGVSHSYVQLQLLPRVPHLDAITACRMSRDGDLVTADGNSLHVFLFACPEPDLESALDRLFVCPKSQLFISQVVNFSDPGILDTLLRLEHKAYKGLPDFSHALEMVAAERAGLEQQATDQDSQGVRLNADAAQLVEGVVEPVPVRQLSVQSRPIFRRDASSPNSPKSDAGGVA